jgi:hypothetical protein
MLRWDGWSKVLIGVFSALLLGSILSWLFSRTVIALKGLRATA